MAEPTQRQGAQIRDEKMTLNEAIANEAWIDAYARKVVAEAEARSAAETSHVHKWVDKALLHEPSLRVCECGATLTNREYRNSDAAYCGASGPHRPHEWIDGVRRRDCPGYKEDAATMSVRP